ncbi:FAD:protein FMN transferase [Vibrio sp. DW001]|uniref:FAD:protein FMN transferase n=1 Tax=Vibrio sp. DW001 TaxID=2912315 RepID=UPI0023B1715C|nr:FAD:protein FMN transferase [Vibrio sp. DW001]WED29558.1 FAD:protein FMN transferase [Vibrio sp. DW001]
MVDKPLTLKWKVDHWQGVFPAMASLCEILIEPCEKRLAQQLLNRAADTTQDIESKFSRYRRDNLCSQINRSNGEPVAIDDETFRLFQFADTCFQISDGMFDITSGVLRKVWTFDGGDQVPSKEQIEQLLPFIGWNKVEFDENQVCIPIGMEVDFGGIGKEYAVDKVANQMREMAKNTSVLVNFGGDLAISQPKSSSKPWLIGFERPISNESQKSINLVQGGLATSGDANRYLLKNGVRYSHIISPKTGWPIEQAPSQVTVAGSNCIQAGLISTIAMLHGKEAKSFLQAQQVPFWIIE